MPYLFTKRQNFRPLLIESIADDNIYVYQKLTFVLRRVENLVGKKRKCWLPAFSLFPTMFSKGFFQRVVKSQDSMVKTFSPFMQGMSQIQTN